MISENDKYQFSEVAAAAAFTELSDELSVNSASKAENTANKCSLSANSSLI